MNRQWVDHSESVDLDECANCGSSVTLNFRRVFGDRENIVHACPECATNREINSGAAAGQEVSFYE